jgi:tRNA threonylcarbamoyladenosine biosynthesis protein TsaB
VTVASRAAARGLVLDLSQSGFAAVLSEDGEEVLAVSARPIEARGTRDNLADWIEGLLAGTGGDIPGLAWICAGLGPGSFTGIRMALAFAQGLATPRRVPLHGFTAFEALFVSFPGTAPGEAAAAIPANAGRFYFSRGLGDDGVLGDASGLAALAQERSTLLVPTAAGFETAAVAFRALRPADGAWDVIRIARHARASGRGLDRPHYLQASAAEDAHAALAKKGAEEKPGAA